MAKTTRREANRISESGSRKVLPKEKFDEIIRNRAYELYVSRGRTQGDELGDWFRAEKMVMKEFRIV